MNQLLYNHYFSIPILNPLKVIAMSLDNLLDATLDDLADTPSIQLFPNGAHKVKVNFKIDKEKSSVQMTLTYVELEELADPTSIAPTPGDKNIVFFNLKKKDGTANEYSQGALKEIGQALVSLSEPGSTTSEVLAAAENAEVMVVTKIRVSKDPKYQDQLDVVKMAVI
jgi:hypothetical protein